MSNGATRTPKPSKNGAQILQNLDPATTFVENGPLCFKTTLWWFSYILQVQGVPRRQKSIQKHDALHNSPEVLEKTLPNLFVFHLGPKMSQNSAPGRGGITHFFVPFPPGFTKDAKMTPQAPKMTPRGPPGTKKHAQSFPKRTPRSPEFNLHCSK